MGAGSPPGPAGKNTCSHHSYSRFAVIVESSGFFIQHAVLYLLYAIRHESTDIELNADEVQKVELLIGVTVGVIGDVTHRCLYNITYQPTETILNWEKMLNAWVENTRIEIGHSCSVRVPKSSIFARLKENGKKEHP